MKGSTSAPAKAFTTVVVVAGAGALAYFGYKFYKGRCQKPCSPEKKPPQPAQQRADSYVQPPPSPKKDASPKPTESFVVIPTKPHDEKPHSGFSSSAGTPPLKNSDDDNSFIKLSIPHEDNSSLSPKEETKPKPDVTDLPLPIQKLDELADFVEENVEESVRKFSEGVAEAEEHVEEHSDTHE